MTKLREAARGRDCMVRIPTVCNGNTDTVVLAHVRLPGTCGTGIKPPDELGAWACSDCHDMLDGRTKRLWDMSLDDLRRFHAEAALRTIYALTQEGWSLRR